MRIAKVWFNRAKKLEIDEAIFLRVASKAEQTSLALALEKEKEEFSKLDTVHSSQLFIKKTLKNMKQYIVIERKYRAPYTAFLKSASGKLSKLTIDPERDRQIRLMQEDGKAREEVENALNGLTDDEIEEFYENKTYPSRY